MQCWASRGEEFDPGPEMRLDHLKPLYNKVLLKCKRDRQSFQHIHLKGAERVATLLVLATVLCLLEGY